MKRPNILIVYTDQQRWDAMGCNGNTEILTPHLDELSKESINFDHCFVQNPVCMPSRVSFLTGQYPSTLGITHMGVPVPEDFLTLPKMLSNQGYYCGNIGKLHFLPHANRDHKEMHPDYGFHHMQISDEPGVYEDAYRAWARLKDPTQMDNLSVGLPPATAQWNEMMKVKDEVVHPVTESARSDHDGAVAFSGREDMTHSAFVGDQTCEFIRERSKGNQTFMCIAGFYSPHAPWVVPQKYLDMYNPNEISVPEYPEIWEKERGKNGKFTDEHIRSAKHGYFAMVTEVDHYVGEIVKTLKEEGIYENTVIVFTSDHGEHLGQRLRFGKGYPGDDGCSRVPLLVRWPGDYKRKGKTVSDVVEALDVLPTLLNAIGMQIPPHLQGKSLQPYKNEEAYVGRETALMEGNGWKNLRTKDYRYVRNDNGEEMLWDISKDPLEHINFVGDEAYQEVKSDLRMKLLEHLSKAERPRRREWLY